MFSPFLSVLRKNIVIAQFSFFSAFHRSQSIGQTSYDSGLIRQDYGIIQGIIGHYQSANQSGKSRMTPVSFVKTTESYKVSLVTINRPVNRANLV